MKYAQSVLDLIGNTPLIKLNHVTDGIKATVLVKLEYVNPGGSIKDRIAAKMLEEAERDGKLKPGGTIIEPTSGNTGVGLALVAQQKGYKCIFVVPDKVGEDKRAVLQAYGAEVVVTPTAVAPDSPQSYYGVSDRLVTRDSRRLQAGPVLQPRRTASHYESTGPEIWRDTDGKVTHCVIGAGTGGTITGTGRYLKEVSADRPDPTAAGSGSSGRTPKALSTRAAPGARTLSKAWARTCGPPTTTNPFRTRSRRHRRRFLRHDPAAGPEEGLLVGGSSGMAVVAALPTARTCPDAVVVVILPDSGRGYLAKIFNDQWMRSYGFLSGGEEASVGEVIKSKTGEMPDLVHIHPNETVRDVINIMNEYGVTTSRCSRRSRR